MEHRPRTTKDLRVFAIGIMVITGIVSGVLLYKNDLNFTVAIWIYLSLSSYGLVSILVPKAITPLYIVFSFVGMILGYINTRLIMVLVYYLVFAPTGLWFRLVRKDPLDRKLSKEAKSYWIETQDEPMDPKQYYQQF